MTSITALNGNQLRAFLYHETSASPSVSTHTGTLYQVKDLLQPANQQLS